LAVNILPSCVARLWDSQYGESAGWRVLTPVSILLTHIAPGNLYSHSQCEVGHRLMAQKVVTRELKSLH